uniref:Glucuronosyltransferase n=1 Tax=Panagrolaimus sp. PS1159 TaxID=55785 RepID=A0AC35FYX6_9BILA
MPKNYSFAPDFSVESTQGNIWESDSLDKLKKMMKRMNQVSSGFCDLILNDNKNLDMLKAENFDLGLTELFSSCGFGIFHKIGVKKYITILGGSVGSFSDTLLGVKNHPSYIPGETTF